ncbi:helix-turn-helix domain-containing protein [Pseudoclavibacter sp. RFBA6]|uniref:helix-turn-helix domain-containing protein n=1 Tax=Pseudoclavibacter sp. RFBA6 TaxID=2080573 RepID=UPI001C671B27|nr:helix-turn-helix domain-containing protein [Pseudoclavibacter sp. RFBA6]
MNKDEATRFGQVVAAQVRAEIAANGQSVAGLARELDMNRETLDRWVKGTRSMTVATLRQIASVLGVEAHEILRRAEERFAAEV